VPTALSTNTPLIASGSVTLSMIVNLKRFTRRDGLHEGPDGRQFERVRGTEAFTAYLRSLAWQAQPPFLLDETERDLLDAAHKMRIFRGYVLEHFFFPTFRLDETAYLEHPRRLDGEQVLIESFPQWDYQLSLTRNGFAIVRMTRCFKDMALPDIAAEIQKVERAQETDDYTESRSNWRIAMDVTAVFLQCIGGKLEFTDEEHHPVRVNFDVRMRKGRLPLHDRFTTIHLDHIHCAGRTVSPDELLTEYAPYTLGLMRLATVLRGGATRDMSRRRVVREADLHNLSPWVSDLCLATNEALLIYSQPPSDPESIRALPGYSRREYWHGVTRGAELLVALKTELQLVERQSTELLASIANLTARVNDGLLSAEDKQRLNKLAEGVSRGFNILPQLRYALISSSLSHATDVVYIFSHLIEQLGMAQISEHVSTNMDELTDFLNYYSSTQLQFEGRMQEESENRTGLTISIMLILLSLVSVPSLIKDFSEIDWARLAAESPVEQVMILALSLLPILLLGVTGFFAYRRLKRR